MQPGVGIITVGAANYGQYLLQYQVELAYNIFQSCYLALYSTTLFSLALGAKDYGVAYFRKITPKFLQRKQQGTAPPLPAARRIQEEEDVLMKTEQAESVEPILRSLGMYCTNSAYLIHFLFVIYLLMQYRDQIGLPAVNLDLSDRHMLHFSYPLFL